MNLRVNKVQKPNWESMTKEEAKRLLLINHEKIATLEERFGLMKFSDYNEISQRLFEKKRRLENKINK